MHRLTDARISEAAGDAERGGGSKTSMHAEAAFAPRPSAAASTLLGFVTSFIWVAGLGFDIFAITRPYNDIAPRARGRC
ncbi:hypothetical protein [Salinisphaera orenii]|uniref:hypothetical protein n=1 Tax=Salinisphaera orenii TaxID=856731 RepID=UPI000DBE8690